MGTPMMGEIKIISWSFAPQGWALCNGQLLPINQNQALFSILGTTYGGDGRVNFALPDLRGRVPLHFGQNTLGAKAGQEFHTVTVAEMPAHTHIAQVSSMPGNTQVASANILAANSGKMYHSPKHLTPLALDTITNVGGSQPHENRQPFIVLNFIIALVGAFPSQN